MNKSKKRRQKEKGKDKRNLSIARLATWELKMSAIQESFICHVPHSYRGEDHRRREDLGRKRRSLKGRSFLQWTRSIVLKGRALKKDELISESLEGNWKNESQLKKKEKNEEEGEE